MNRQEQLEDNIGKKSDIDYDSFIDVHKREESSEFGTAQLKSVQIINSEEVPQSYLDSSPNNSVLNSNNYYKFDAEIIGDKMTDNIEIYIRSNSDKIDIMKDWSGVDFFKDLPYKEVPIKHISENIYTIPNFRKFLNKNIKVSKIRELYEEEYIGYNPRSKSWETKEFSNKDKIKYSVYDKLGVYVISSVYLTLLLSSMSVIGILSGITLLFVLVVYLQSINDNIPRIKLSDIK